MVNQPSGIDSSAKTEFDGVASVLLIDQQEQGDKGNADDSQRDGEDDQHRQVGGARILAQVFAGEVGIWLTTRMT